MIQRQKLGPGVTSRGMPAATKMGGGKEQILSWGPRRACCPAGTSILPH